jgi:response regulator RpfG family c-di-GMP phosphodiesterase
MRILIVDDDDNNRNILSFHLENIFESVQITEFNCGNDAIAFLNKKPKIDLIISDYEMKNGDGALVYQTYSQKRMNIPFLLLSTRRTFDNGLLSSFPNKEKNEYYIEKPINRKILITFVEDVFKSHYSVSKNDYQKVRVFNLFRFNMAICDFHLKTRNKYIKFIKEGSSYTKKDLDKYITKDHAYIYIREDDVFKLEDKLQDSGLTNYEGSFKNKNDQHEILNALIHSLTLSVGLSEEVVSETQKITDSIINEIKKDKSSQISKLLDSIKSNDLYIHNRFLANICYALIAKVSWCTEDIQRKLVTASIIHDLMLTDATTPYSQIESFKKVLEKDKDLKKDYYQHPTKMRDLVLSSKNLPPNIDDIIFQHHEWPDGTGFPKGLFSASISPLSRVFIVAHAFVDEYEKEGFRPEKINHILLQLKDHFSDGNFSGILKNLTSVLSVNDVR